MTSPRIPTVGTDGLYRLNCPRCGKLVFRFHPSLRGGPLQIPCRPSCKDARGERNLEVYFNEAGPGWDGTNWGDL